MGRKNCSVEMRIRASRCSFANCSIASGSPPWFLAGRDDQRTRVHVSVLWRNTDAGHSACSGGGLGTPGPAIAANGGCAVAFSRERMHKVSWRSRSFEIESHPREELSPMKKSAKLVKNVRLKIMNPAHVAIVRGGASAVPTAPGTPGPTPNSIEWD